MQFGWTADEATSFAVLDAFVEAGGNFIDTADVYSRWAEGNPGGVSEQIIGRWMKARGNRGAIVLATKARGRMWDGPNGEGLSRGHLIHACEDSLRRLDTDSIDLYQTHFFDADTPIDETLRALDDLVRAGKVRYCRVLELSRVAAGEGALGQRQAGLGALRLAPAALQPGVPRRVRARAEAVVRGRRDRRHPLQPAGRRLPHREVSAGQRAPQRPRRRHPAALLQRPRLRHRGEAGRGRQGAQPERGPDRAGLAA